MLTAGGDIVFRTNYGSLIQEITGIAILASHASSDFRSMTILLENTVHVNASRKKRYSVMSIFTLVFIQYHIIPPKKYQMI